MHTLSRTRSINLRRRASAALAAVSLTIVFPLSPAFGQSADEPAPAPTTKPAPAPTPEPTVLPEAEVDEPLFESRDQFSAATIAFNGTANSANARWLVDLYEDVLLRPADLGGLDHWLARVAAGGDRSRSAVARSFLNSEEGARGEVVRAYADLLDRQPDAGGLAFWTGFLRTNPVTTLRFGHLASDEYFAKSGGTIDGFVERLYQELLFRGADAGGRAYYRGQIESGRSRGWVVATIYRSDESMSNRVRAYYVEVLGRQPTAPERTAGADMIRRDDERALRAHLLSSDEAFEIFYEAATGP